MPARLRPAAAATKRRDRRVSERIQSIADIDTLQEDNFDVDSGRHFDHRLILLGALDQIFRDHVARLGHALAKASLQNLTGRELFALSVGGDVGALEHAVRVRCETAANAAGQTRDARLGAERALAEHNPPPHPGLPADAEDTLPPGPCKAPPGHR